MRANEVTIRGADEGTNYSPRWWFIKISSRSDETIEEMAELIQVRPPTLSRRKAEGRLQPDESDCALRLFGRALQEPVVLLRRVAAEPTVFLPNLQSSVSKLLTSSTSPSS